MHSTGVTRQRVAQLWSELVRGRRRVTSVQARLVQIVVALRTACERDGFANTDAELAAGVRYLSTRLRGGAEDRPLQRALDLVAARDVRAMDGEPSALDLIDAAVVDFAQEHRELLDGETGDRMAGRIATFDLGADVHPSLYWWPLPRNWDPEVCTAARSGDIRRLALALDSGGHPDSPASKDSRRTGLWEVIERGKPDVIEMLLRRGADPNRPDLDGVDPLLRCLQLARRRGSDRLPILDLLLKHGADLDRRLEGGETVLYRAYSPSVLRHLIHQGQRFDPCVVQRKSGQSIWSQLDMRGCQDIKDSYIAKFGIPSCGGTAAE